MLMSRSSSSCSSQRCSVGLRSGFCAGHSSSSTFLQPSHTTSSWSSLCAQSCWTACLHTHARYSGGDVCAPSWTDWMKQPLYCSIHPSSSAYSFFRVTGNLEPIAGSIGHKAGYTLDRVPIHCRTQSHAHSHTHLYATDTLDMSIILPCMSLDWGRKPEYPEETPAARGGHANSAHTGPRWELNPGGARQMC
ncbi:hypothetical protein AMELA_G00205710 [Ameiurus melas]|uniref:Uncharacterized protein n=1 Tax=Ameiurus melas TaxID=219545 RepID=A0A7J6A747_AMEME|nr:hypothetical protein AMELA_G00205710 [Ameiurus melas]